jgi:hypothetical protein
MAERYLTNQMAHALIKSNNVPDKWFDLIHTAAYKNANELSVKQYNMIIKLFNMYILSPASQTYQRRQRNYNDY